jgi:hypothetical protein
LEYAQVFQEFPFKTKHSLFSSHPFAFLLVAFLS